MYDFYADTPFIGTFRGVVSSWFFSLQSFSVTAISWHSQIRFRILLLSFELANPY
jgi:hypothetical protein